MTANWSRDELESAFRTHESTIAAAASTGDWEPFVQLFTEDAHYVDPMVGAMRGHAEIRGWVNATLATFPGSAMHFPASWYLIDEERGRIVCELRNVMRDAGDGIVHEESNISILTYAGDGRFASERDVYDSTSFVNLIQTWGERALACDTLSDDEVDWFRQMMPAVLES
jgi:hypothetical protein